MYPKRKSLSITKRLAVWLLILLFTCQPVLAATQVEADPAAATGKQPQVSNAPNGVTMVQITTPNGAGVSHNLYRNLQVGSDGLILNNSYVIVNTQLAGYIPGNPALAGGSAKIILNEVTGSLPSQLKGYMEIAGQKAILILANPNGIVGDGFGFINANRAVLTTGIPVFGGSGSLDAFRVTGGQIAIQGNGLNASNTDQVDLISRAITVNAGIWANQLNVVTGANQVDYNTLNTQKSNGDATTPQVALDVGQLGGMYAQKIYLVGTEKGVGVNYQGILSATGDVNVTNEGKVILGNQTSAGGNLTIAANDDVTNQGTVYAQGNANVITTGTLTNAGTLASAQNTTVVAQNVSSAGTLGAGIKSDGAIGNTGDLSITAIGAISATGQNQAGGNITITGASVNQSGAITVAGNSATITATNGDVNHTGAALTANGTVAISASGAVKNDKNDNGTAGQITAKNVSITANDISNKGGSIQQTGSEATTITAANNMDNTGGTIATNGQADIQAQNIDNTQGTISGQQKVGITAASLTNTQGTVISSDAVNITAQGVLANTQQGLIQANKGLNITAQSLNNQNGSVKNLDTNDLNMAINQDIQNQSGIIGGNGNVNITAQSLANQGGQVLAQSNLTITAAQGVDNTGGMLSAHQDLALNKSITDASRANLNNANGSLQAGNALTVQGAVVNNTGGSLAANRDIQLTAQSLSGNGKANAGQDLTITLSGDLTNGTGGELNSGRNLVLTATRQINNQGSITAVQNASLSGSDITSSTTASIAANGALNLAATGNLANNGRLQGSAVTVSGQDVSNSGTVTADTLTVQANTINNDIGALMNATGDINLGPSGNPAGSVTNQGTIYAQGNANINTTGTLTNTGTMASVKNTTVVAQNISSTGTLGAGIKNDGTIGNTGDLSITAAGAINATGQNLAGANLTITGADINQSGATTVAGGAATITATNGDINHTGAVLQVGGAATISATGTVKNDKNANGTAGQITAGKVSITANDISNKGGSILQTGADATAITVANSIDNAGGTIATRGSSLLLQADVLNNNHGKIQHAGTGTMNVAVNGNLNNTSGQVATNGHLQLNAGSITNQVGIILAQQANIQSQGNIDNSNNGTIYAGNLTATAQSDIVNTGGTIQAGNGLALNAQNINNAGGTIVNTGATTALNLTAANNLNNQSGFIGSNGQMAITADSIDNANNTMSSQGDFALKVNGDFTNQGTLESNGTLAINAANINNAASGTINGNNTNITANGNLTNDGQIEGNQVILTSQNMTNNSTVIGGAVTVNANNLTNQGQSGLIAATDSVNLWVSNTLTNQNGANIISLGDINIAANSQRDGNGQLVNRTQQVTNSGSTIEAAGNINLAAENVANIASGDPVIGTTTSTSTKVWTMAPHISWYYPDYYTYENDPNIYYILSSQPFGGPGQTNSKNGLYCKLSVTVPKENVISYDANQKKLVFNDITSTPKMLICGPGVQGYWDENQIENFFNTRVINSEDSSYSDYMIYHYYTYNLDIAPQFVYPQRADYTILPVFEGTSNWGWNVGNIAAPTWAGKEPGKTTAYCQSVNVNAAGDYVISFYPGYDPNVNLSPENQRTMPTYHSDNSAEESRTTTTTTQTEYIASAPTIGQIHVGQNLSLNIGQQFTNQYSQIAVGNAVTGNIGTLQNKGYRLTQTSTSTDVSYFHDYFITGGDGHVASSDGWQTVGPYSSTQYIDGGIPATFTAKTIAVTGTNVVNIQQRPDGTAGPQIGATINPSSPTGTSISTSSPSTVNVSSTGNSTPASTIIGVTGGNTGNSQVQTSGTPVPQTGTAITATSTSQTVDFTVTGGRSILAIPQNGLYQTHPEPTSEYLVETNSRFTNYHNFISSDYLFNLLSLDPAKTQKRLGDGFYEQKLVNEQINQLTGRQYLAGYDNNDTEFKALMDNGVAAAKTLSLVPGIALTGDQISKLTTDLVWMVEEEVTLPSGEKQTALVPVVYIAPASKMKLTGGGALIAADKVDINVSGNVLNSGTIAGESSLSIQGNNLTNANGGQITSNEATTLKAVTDIINQSGVISGKQVLVEAGRDVINETTTTQISASTRDSSTGHSWTGTNTIVGPQATIQSQGDLTVVAGRDISVQGGNITADGNAAVNAGRNLTVGTVAAANNGKDTADRQNYSHNDTTNVASAIQGTNVALTSQGDTTLTGTQVTAGKDLTVAVQGNLVVNTAKDIHSEAKSNDGSYARSTYDETTIGSNLQAGNDIKISAVQSGNVPVVDANKGKITVEGSSITSQDGSVSIIADQGVTIKEVTEKHESLTETRSTKSGFLSSTSTYTRDYSLVNQVKGSTISGDKVDISSGADLNVKGSNVVGTNDVTLTAKNDVNITSAAETGASEHYREEKTSGIFGGGGFGFTIGSKSEKTTLNEQTIDEIGSTVGSINGNVNITAGNKVNSAGTTFVSGKDTNIIGKDVTIDNTVNTYDSQYKYEFKQSGLSVSLGGGIVDTATNASNSIQRSGEVQDDRLKELYDYKAAKDIKDLKNELSGGLTKANLEKGVAVSVSIGSTQMTSEQTVHTETVNTSNINAGGNVNITATAGDVNLKGTKIDATDITLDAKNNVNIEGAENKQQTTSNISSSSWSVGGTIGTGFFANGSSGSGKENENSTTNIGSVINASDTLKLKSGEDTNIIGSQVKGGTVVADVGGNLNIASTQDTDNYTAKNQNSGFGVSTGPKGGVTGSIGTGKTDSTYASVTEQAGIYAGQGGFDINVGKNTDLTGAVIASTTTPDKNKLDTGSLTYSNIQNNANYSSSSIGVNLDTHKYGKDDPNYKNQGLTPNIGVTASGNASSTTQSAISAGTIIVGGKKVDPAGLSRDTTNSLNALGKIFDKETVQEQQELASLFGEEAFKAIGDLGLKENDPNKVALKAIVGGIMSQMTGGSFGSGAVSAGFTQIVTNQLANIKDPALLQWASYVVGAAASTAVGGNAQTGGSIAVNDIRNNYLTHEQYAQYQAQLKELKDKLENGSITREEYDAAVKDVDNYWSAKDIEQNKQWLAEHHIDAVSIDDENGRITLKKDQYQQMLSELSNSKNDEETAAIKAKWRKVSLEQIDEWSKMGNNLGQNLNGSNSYLYPDLSAEVVNITNPVKNFIDKKVAPFVAKILQGQTVQSDFVENNPQGTPINTYDDTGRPMTLVQKADGKIVMSTEEYNKYLAQKQKDKEVSDNVEAKVSMEIGGNIAGDAVDVASTATKFKEVKSFTAEETNQWFVNNVKSNYKPPYKPGTIVREIELTDNTTFVRVYDKEPNGSGMYGSWVMKAKDIEGLTPEQIRDKFALPSTPKYVCDVEISAGTHMRVGEVNPVEGWGNGGGTQYDLIGQRVGEFKNERSLK